MKINGHRVGIITTAYNTESYLIRCIRSVINQKHGNFTLTIIDDGSYDKSSYYATDLYCLTSA